MTDRADYIELITRAQRGDRVCLDQLAELARPRLQEYVYRLVLDDNSTQDIVQETILQMFKALGELKKPDRFWPWLFRIAMSRISRHHRTENRQKRASEAGTAGGARKDQAEALENLVSSELKQIVAAAMKTLQTRQRAVLTMRCYNDMTYSEIADVLNCSKFAARQLFCRAKLSLQKQLSRQGFGKGSLLMALTLFGKMTASSEAAAASVSLTATTMKAGLAASVAGMIGAKTAIVSLTAAGALVVGTTMVISQPDKTTQTPPPIQASTDSHMAARTADQGKAVDRCWYYYPPNADGAVMMRLLRADSKRNQPYLQSLHDEEANYYFDKKTKTINLENCRPRQGDLSVWRLPNDRRALSEFLSQIDGRTEITTGLSGGTDGLLVISRRNDDRGDGFALETYHYHVLEEVQFRYNWPIGAKLVDKRDPMHKRGWTHFTIAGQIDGRQITGTGQLPFVYTAGRRRPAWLKLKLAEDIELTDTARGACIRDASGKVIASYPPGAFFAGLSRPWMGLHTIDTIRRDAAAEQIPFETEYKDPTKIEITLKTNRGKILYTVDTANDLLDTIKFSTNNNHKGILQFSYLQQLDETDNKFKEPWANQYAAHQTKPGPTWILELATKIEDPPQVAH